MYLCHQFLTEISVSILIMNLMKRTAFYTSNMKMADLINADYKLLLLLPRFDIELGFGDQTVQKSCEEHGISPDFFLMICNIYSFDDYLPEKKEIRTLDVHQLIAYLKKSHQYYLDNRLNGISKQMHSIIEQSETKHGNILTRFFEEYKKEVVNHFQYEEETVFPYILGIADGEKSAGYQIEMFEENHTNIEDKLNDLKNILIKYLPEKTSSEKRINLLFNLFDFEVDLDKHTLLEDLVLVPKVHIMEKHYESK